MNIENILLVVGVCIVMVWLCNLAYEKGIKHGKLKMEKELEESLLSETNTGFYEAGRYMLRYTSGKEIDYTAICEVEELYRSVDNAMSKVNVKSVYSLMKEVPDVDLNKPNVLASMPTYIETAKIKWYTDPNDRKVKIKKLMEAI
jgi:hypothetical protein